MTQIITILILITLTVIIIHINQAQQKQTHTTMTISHPPQIGHNHLIFRGSISRGIIQQPLISATTYPMALRVQAIIQLTLFQNQRMLPRR